MAINVVFEEGHNVFRSYLVSFRHGDHFTFLCVFYVFLSCWFLLLGIVLVRFS